MGYKINIHNYFNCIHAMPRTIIIRVINEFTIIIYQWYNEVSGKFQCMFPYVSILKSHETNITIITIITV